jgi:hypothetical protein
VGAINGKSGHDDVMNPESGQQNATMKKYAQAASKQIANNVQMMSKRFQA